MNASTPCQAGTSAYLQEIVVLLLIRRQRANNWGMKHLCVQHGVHLSALIQSFIG